MVAELETRNSELETDSSGYVECGDLSPLWIIFPKFEF